jgi:hypothetical protein
MAMRQLLITVIVLAFVFWLTLGVLVTSVAPEPPATWAFLALFFLALSTTLVPPIYYLHLRFGDARKTARPATYVRQAFLIGGLVAYCLWMQTLQSLSLGIVLMGVAIVGIIELFVARQPGA